MKDEESQKFLEPTQNDLAEKFDEKLLQITE